MILDAVAKILELDGSYGPLSPLQMRKLVADLAWVADGRELALALADLMLDRSIAMLAGDDGYSAREHGYWDGAWTTLLVIARGDECAREQRRIQQLGRRSARRIDRARSAS